ncbi:flagellar export protein FliJ [Paenibacillus harenae]|uniref:flagellar export protein FliJ n=1 Tax=Paenibacillus harenae TaxID=306543 RepID=UPI00279365E7|nr:flagellar export protein FliJ [Paenibacillus harenae]MDQ0059662.1 flagellar FliJ protein [Paenibacillus harenae]
MAAFRYSFQKIVDLKSSEKTQAEWILSAAVGALAAEEQSLEQLHASKREWEIKLIEASQTEVSLMELQVIQQYLDHLVTCIANKMSDVLQAKKKVEHRRGLLTEKMKDEKVWLKAKDHAFDRFRSALQVKEQNELDEMATVRFMISTP